MGSEMCIRDRYVHRFIEYVLSEEGQAIVKGVGYLPVRGHRRHGAESPAGGGQ